jgi:hypothetical protein
MSNSYYKYMTTILRKLRVPNPYKIAQLFSMEDRYFFYKDWHAVKPSYGGGDKTVKKINVIYTTADKKEFNFTVRKLEESDRVTYSVINEIYTSIECVLIIYEKQQNFCYLDGIHSDQINNNFLPEMKQCFLGISISNKGSLLLNFALDFIEQYIARKYDVRYIQLRDNSFKKCKMIKKNIDLDSLYMFTHGETWYGKYGFIPFDFGLEETNNNELNDYIRNQNIVKTTLVKNTKIKQYIHEAIKELNIIDNHIDKKIDVFQNESIMIFLKYFTKNYDSMCGIFGHFYKQLMKDLKMVNLHGRSYWKQLSQNVKLISESFETKN